MKKLITIFCILIYFISNAQNLNQQGINYQAVARDNNGQELINQNLTIRFSITNGNISNSNIYWQETHSVNTNNFGLFSAIIGEGNSTGNGSFSSFNLIEWASETHQLQVEVDYGIGYINMGSTQFMSVPYSYHAQSSSDNKWIENGSSITNKDSTRVDIKNHLAINNASQLLLRSEINATRGYLRANEGSPHLNIATSNYEDIAFRDGGTSGQINMFIKGFGGNVGIGTTTPSKRLDVNGDINFTGDLYKNDTLIQQPESLWQSYGSRIYNKDSTEVEINNNLYINNGNELRLRTETGSLRGHLTASNSSPHLTIATSGGEDIAFKDGGTSIWAATNMLINGYGNVGIGTVNPINKLEVNGDILAMGQLLTFSDLKFKHNINPLENALYNLEKINVKTYDFKKNKYINFSKEKQYGLIAQEIEEIFPELVSEKEITIEKGPNSTEKISFKAINYDQLIPILIKSIQEQQKIINRLQEEINNLKDQ